jgi:gliding motility-associated-like protein
VEGEGDYKCTSFRLDITKTEDALIFYTINGGRMEIQRKYTINYDALKWSENDKKYIQSTETIGPKIIGTDEPVDIPLMNTVFKLRGDQFAGYFNIAKEISSQEYQAIAVQGHIVAEQEGRDNGESTETTLGGSAPATINLYGRANEPVAHFFTWYIYNREDMNNYIARYTDKDIRYTFDRTGNFVVQLEVADRNSVCVGDTISLPVSIDESEIRASNYFSPGGATNNEFKFVYKSIIRFKCTIFNRWGTKIYQWSDITKGWDGKHNGKYVSTGVYYWVAEYTTGDGKRRSKDGDINILKRK